MSEFLVNTTYFLIDFVDDDTALYQSSVTGERVLFHIAAGYFEPVAA